MELIERPRVGLRHITEAQADQPVIVESEEKDDGMTKFSGYFLRWEDVAEIKDVLGSYKEQFVSGSFTKTFNERGPKGNRAIKMLRNHDTKLAQAGQWLDLFEDSEGPAFEAETIPTDVGKNVAVEIRSGVLNTMSIGFDDLSQDNYDQRQNMYTVREAKLYEASPVLWPAYSSATIDSVRSIEEIIPIFNRMMAVLENGVELTNAQIGQLSLVRSRIGTLLDGPDESPPKEASRTGVTPATTAGFPP